MQIIIQAPQDEGLKAKRPLGAASVYNKVKGGLLRLNVAEGDAAWACRAFRLRLLRGVFRWKLLNVNGLELLEGGVTLHTLELIFHHLHELLLVA